MLVAHVMSTTNIVELSVDRKVVKLFWWKGGDFESCHSLQEGRHACFMHHLSIIISQSLSLSLSCNSVLHSAFKLHILTHIYVSNIIFLNNRIQHNRKKQTDIT